jgi:hypothetical protein
MPWPPRAWLAFGVAAVVLVSLALYEAIRWQASGALSGSAVLAQGLFAALLVGYGVRAIRNDRLVSPRAGKGGRKSS